ncbi:hypothetical protein [Cytophaga hutchinsonii]|uniref:Uncharacterized protein n=1 Tax=Cytophaga hutchinsonii (strain ATCC 33406 / DSM 1761 / CIP 103989 / NBRC 15051 / NCIMB 9469 / D465) TaxID=269798 RepID=A0A6N4SPT0_CYTH3|nr:hypothetical protein [Cytophaga hutchinsonii]ABG58347.1 conserved hypothetical protein [Cytophaga hutchinsonii ATCC 33406]SFX52070.1 hypothetical protein SAMN04487930_10584 [Cytophaga hutchinsonii ATCC 33406]
MNKILQLFFAFGICSFFIACNHSDGPAYRIEPPFKSIPPHYDTFELNASEPKMLRLPGGSSIEIPANAFVDKSGKPVTGKVELKYREFHTSADILASGIPMLCNDEDGITKSFESGGMFEISATANGQEIDIAKDKKINVHMASDVEGDFDFYYLEEDGNKKTANASLFLQTQPAPLSEKQYRWKKIYAAKEEGKDAAPERSKASVHKYFQTHFDIKKYPETAVLDTMKWEYAGITKMDDPADPANTFFKEEKWAEVSISQPVYYTEKIKEVKRNKNNNGRHTNSLVMLPDSLGILVNEAPGYLCWYEWNGNLKTRFNGVEGVKYDYYAEGAYGYENFSFINKQQSHLLLFDENNHCKLFSVNGKLIKDFGVLSDPSFDHTGNKIIGQTGTAASGNLSVVIFSITGEVLHTFPVTVAPYSIINDYWQLFDDQSKFALINNDKISVIDTDGKTISSTHIDKIYYLDLLSYHQAIAVHTYDSQLWVWDWKKNKSLKVKFDAASYSTSMSPKEPVIIIHKDHKNVFWNWENDTYKEIANVNNVGLYYSFKGNFIYSYNTIIIYTGAAIDNNTKQSTYLFNNSGTLIRMLDKSRSYSFRFDEREERILISGDTSELYLIDKSGKLLYDFKTYDPKIKTVHFYTNGEMLSTTEDGTVVLWNKNIEPVHSVVAHTKMTSFFPDSPGTCYSIGRLQATALWDIAMGKKLYAYDDKLVFNAQMFDYRTDKHVVIPKHVALSFDWSDTKSVNIWKNTSVKLPEGVYHINFRNNSADFQTYVYLSAEQLEQINKYQHALKQRINKEIKNEVKRADQEAKLLRSFEINNFGIYNWDRFYKDSNALSVHATIDLGNSVTEFNHVTLFLITGKDRNVVVKYYVSTLNKFCFVPEDHNMLLAILPDDRIAVFEEGKFRALDIEKLKKDNAYTFNMTILEEQASRTLLDRILQKPS